MPAKNRLSAVSPPGIARTNDKVLDDTASQCSHWSMTEYGALDWDHSGDEFDNIEVRPKITRRASSASPRDAAKVRAAFLDAVSGRNTKVQCERITRRAFMASPGDSAKARAAFRDAVKPSKRKAKSEPPSARKTSTVVRDAHGRFAKWPALLDTVQTRKRSASTPASLGGSRNLLVSSSKKDTPVPPPQRIDFSALRSTPNTSAVDLRISSVQELVTPPEPNSSSIASIQEKKDSDVKRDSKGRFARKNNPSLLKVEEAILPKPKSGVDVAIPTKARAKAKRAPAKSPYFSPPVTPAKVWQGKKDAAAQFVAEYSQQDTPVKDEETVQLSQGSAKKRVPGSIVSCIPFPPLSAPLFGLIQEKLAHDPFRLLIAVTFLIRTHGKHAIPVFYELIEKYPTPEALVAAKKQDIVPVIRHLGLQNQRASTYQMYAKIWLEDPPMRDKRYPREIIPDSDERAAWEIGHMTQGPYAIDSWRIFCRDVLRGVADGYNGEGTEEGFQPEWMRVVPEDKELRAYLRWMWLKEGFEWDPFTGEKEVASKELMKAAMEGRIAWDDAGGMRILDKVMDVAPGLSQVGNI
ncbi:hypothetical protein BKA64DRAFT_702206 [Cadophora sp. MPI-SDFR-AT-0126]|nr:hypothetical protein BKA64DRAFT_702206 [Leotiomycetes sp. MPI-SDFR-AT-0126]